MHAGIDTVCGCLERTFASLVERAKHCPCIGYTTRAASASDSNALEADKASVRSKVPSKRNLAKSNKHSGGLASLMEALHWPSTDQPAVNLKASM